MHKSKLIILLPLVTLLISFSSIVFAADDTASTSSDIDPDTIKENIKKRIEQVIESQRTDNKPQKKIALLGTISTMTPNSITIETTDSNIEQASTSAETVYVQTANSKTVKREDASIGDFVAALGFMEPGVEVLDTRRILILGQAPATPEKTSFFGSIASIDTRKNRLELTDINSNETKLFSVTTKSKITLSQPDSLTNQELTIEDLNLGQLAMVIYTPATASTSASPITTMLIKSAADNTSNGAN